MRQRRKRIVRIGCAHPHELRAFLVLVGCLVGFVGRCGTSGGIQLDEIRSAIQNPNNSLHFDMTGFSQTQYKMFNPNDIVRFGNITNFEIHTIINTSGALDRTTFYKLINGAYQEISRPYWIK